MQITGSGVTISYDTKLAAVGDFVGNVFIHETAKKTTIEPIYKINIMYPVRCLIWNM